MRFYFLFFIFFPIITLSQIQYIEDVDSTSKKPIDLFSGITTIHIRAVEDFTNEFSTGRSMPRNEDDKRTSFQSNLANALGHSFERLNFKIKISLSPLNINDCKALYIDLSDLNIQMSYFESKNINTPINIPIFSCDAEFELASRFILKKKKNDYWNKRLFYNQAFLMLNESNIYSIIDAKSFTFKNLIERKDLKIVKNRTLYLGNKKIILDNPRAAEKMFKEYWTRNFFSGDPIEGIYQQTSYYHHRKTGFETLAKYKYGSFYNKRFKIVVMLDDSNVFYNIFYLNNLEQNTENELFKIGDLLGRIFKTDIINNFELECSFDPSNKFNSEKNYFPIKVAFGGYENIGERGYKISNDEYNFYERISSNKQSYSFRKNSLSSTNIDGYLKNSEGFFVFYNTDEMDWEFNAYFKKLFSPKKIDNPPTLKNNTTNENESNSKRIRKKTAVKKPAPPAAKRKG